MSTLLERFTEKVFHCPISGCWLWGGSSTAVGYGQIWVEGKQVLAHRASFLIFKGVRVPSSLMVLHKCDTPACVNPDHLWLGTNTDNMADRSSKRRSARGEGHGLAKLTTTQAAEIRAKYAKGGVSQRALADEYSVSQRTVLNIHKNQIWKEI